MGGEQAFYSADARKAVALSIKEIEKQTSAEVVVAVRHLCGFYRDIDFTVGFAAALLTLIILIFAEREFDPDLMPVDVAVFFVLGTLGTRYSGPFRRALVSKTRRHAETQRSARAAFVELGIGRTTERMGVLVFVSLFERQVIVVPDVGINPKALGDKWTAAVSALEGSIAQGADFASFEKALSALGPVLGAVIPHAAGKINELPDEVDE